MGIEKYRQWMKEASVDQKRAVARASKTSLSHMYQLSNGHRKASSELAARLERGISLVNKGTSLPEVKRGDISDVCCSCFYYIGCDK